jgi:CBS domain-containing protein
VNRDFPSQQSLYFTEFLVSQLSAPSLATLLDEAPSAPPIVALNSTVDNACKIMQTEGSTAVLVLENQSSQIAGIYLD